MLSYLVLALQAAAQPPATDIYVADLRVVDGRVQVGPLVNVTARPGYDNQPFFLPDGRAFLYTSIREDSQADIYRYDLERATSVRLTATRESEYSPTPLPDGRGFSTVRVEADRLPPLRRGRIGVGERSSVPMTSDVLSSMAEKL